MRNPLLDCRDASWILALLDIYKLLRKINLLLLDGLSVLDDTDRNIRVDVTDNIKIDIHIIVSYGVNIPSVCDNLLETVKYKVEEFTGLKVEKINIYVEGVRVID